MQIVLPLFTVWSLRDKKLLWRGIALAVCCTVAIVGSPTLTCAEEDENFQTQIFVGEPDGSNLKRLTDLPEYKAQGSPSWSADGRYIAFDAFKPQLGEQYFMAHVIVVEADGTNPRDMGVGLFPTLSPKGRRVAYCRHANVGSPGVFIADLDDPETVALVDEDGWGVEWSPDGTRLAYTRKANLHLYDLIEGTITPVLDPERAGLKSIQSNFCWSADSRRIAFKAVTMEGKDILAVTGTDGEKNKVEIIYEGSLRPPIAWNPLQGEILIERFDDDFPSLFRINLDKPAEPVRLQSKPINRRIGNAAFSHDGKKLAVCVHRRQPGDK